MKLGRTEIITLVVLLLAVLLASYLAYRITVQKKIATSDAGVTLNSEDSEKLLFTTVDGDPFTFDKYHGKVRVVNVWATWSPFSKNELRALNTVAAQNKSDDLVMIAINRMEDALRVKNYLKSLGPLNEIIFVQDLTDAYYKRIEGFSMPETIIYDRAGAIILHRRGAMSEEELEAAVQTALNQE